MKDKKIYQRIYQRIEGLAKGKYYIIVDSTRDYVTLKNLSTGFISTIPRNFFKRYYVAKYDTHTINVTNYLFETIKTKLKYDVYCCLVFDANCNKISESVINYKYCNNIRLHNVVILKNKKQETLYFNVVHITQSKILNFLYMDCISIAI